MKRSLLCFLSITYLFASELGASARQPQADTGSQGGERQMKVCVAERQVPLTSRMLHAESIVLNKVNQEIQRSLKEALASAESVDAKQYSNAVHEGSGLPRELCSLVTECSRGGADKLASIIKRTFSSQVQAHMALSAEQWGEYGKVLVNENPPELHWPHKPALLQKWKSSEFERAPVAFASDRVMCKTCQATHIGLQPWQEPGYYHKKACPFFKPFPFNDVSASQMVDIFQALDVLARGSNEVPKELQESDVQAVVSLWRNFKHYAALAQNMLISFDEILRARAQEAARHGLTSVPYLKITTYRLEEGKCRNDK